MFKFDSIFLDVSKVRAKIMQHIKFTICMGNKVDYSLDKTLHQSPLTR